MDAENSDEDIQVCLICFNELPQHDFYVLELCRCTYCTQCIIAYTEHEIRSGRHRIPCPDGTCEVKAVLTDREVRSLVSGVTLQRYDKLLEEAKVFLDPRRVYCPAPDCPEVCVVDPSGPTKVVCTGCSTAFCRLCSSAWHEGQSCEAYLNKTARFSELGIRRCPGCGIPLQKVGGCPRIQCHLCGEEFCWN